MNTEEGALSPETVENRVKSPDDICVLLLDGDPTCLMIISKMLQKSGYRVLTAERASDALSIIKDKDAEIDLIMAETHLPDMDKYELLETIGEISDLPVIIMAADQHENTMLGCLFKGAAFYLLKPLVMDDLKNLWQFAVKNKHRDLHRLDCDPAEQNGSDDYTQTSSYADEPSLDKKRKGRAETEKDKESDETCELGDQKKQKLISTEEPENTFSQETRDLEIDGAYADKISQPSHDSRPSEEDIFAQIQEEGVMETLAISQTASNFQGGFPQFPGTTVPANLESQTGSSNNVAQMPLQSEQEEAEANQGEIDVSDMLELGFDSLLDWPDLGQPPVQEQEDQQQQQQQQQQQVQDSSEMPRKSTEELIDELFNDIW